MTVLAALAWLAEPWQDGLVRRAFLELALVGLAAGPLGCWLVFYGLSYSAESLSHALLPGLVLAALAGLPLVLGGLGGIVVAALAVAAAGRTPAIGRDTGVAVVVTALLGLGVLLALSPASPPRLGELLFGDVLGVADLDLVLAGVVALAATAALVVLHPRLLAVGFDRGAARGLRVSAAGVDAALLVLLAVVLLVAVQGLGNLLVVAVLIAPAACARLVMRRMGPMMATAAAVAVLGSWAGLYVSYHAAIAAGAAIALTFVALYVVLAALVALRAAGVRRPAATS